MRTIPAGAACAMPLVDTSTAVSTTIADDPVFAGQAIRYALAADPPRRRAPPTPARRAPDRM
ncbi:hypothetical protein [Streptomyces triticirhizae]|uniref:hypothetical protein n=1 Tax=Streptomyces triticirhizae TaxID=2483353 RepID=UPI0011C43784|nr:hypothetical protein [Streptomyces triticirhizae]